MLTLVAFIAGVAVGALVAPVTRGVQSLWTKYVAKNPSP